MKIRFSSIAFCNLFGVIVIALPGFAIAQETEIFSLINERLSYMEDVALYKDQNNLPVEDLEREKIVIENAVAAATEIGLIGSSIESFFNVQIKVAKAIQYRSIANWISEPTNRKASDLVSDIRPALTSLGDDIVNGLLEYLVTRGPIQESQRGSFHLSISIQNVSTADKDLLFDSLLRVRPQ